MSLSSFAREYEQEAQSLLEACSQAIGRGELSQARQALTKASAAIKQLELQARLAPAGSEERKDIQQAAKDFKLVHSSRQSQLQRAELRLNAASQGLTPEDLQKRRKEQQLLDTLERDDQALKAATGTALQTEQLNSEILGELRGQREQMMNVRSNLRDIDSELTEGKETLNTMDKRNKECLLM